MKGLDEALRDFLVEGSDFVDEFGHGGVVGMFRGRVLEVRVRLFEMGFLFFGDGGVVQQGDGAFDDLVEAREFEGEGAGGETAGRVVLVLSSAWVLMNMFLLSWFDLPSSESS